MSIQAADLQFVRELVKRETAIVIDADRAHIVESRLVSLARQENATCIEELLSSVRTKRDPGLSRRVAAGVATNETAFFQDVRAFAALRSVVIPDLIAKRKAEKTLTIWCVGCGRGQEAYSIAMVMKGLGEFIADYRVRIIATDLSHGDLDRAKKGLYSQIEVNRGLPGKLLAKWFAPFGAHFEAHEQLRGMIEFSQLEIANTQDSGSSSWSKLPPVDLVLARNALSRFDGATRREVLQRIRGVMRADGALVLAAGEASLSVAPLFERSGTAGIVLHHVRES